MRDSDSSGDGVELVEADSSVELVEVDSSVELVELDSSVELISVFGGEGEDQVSPPRAQVPPRAQSPPAVQVRSLTGDQVIVDQANGPGDLYHAGLGWEGAGPASAPAGPWFHHGPGQGPGGVPPQAGRESCAPGPAGVFGGQPGVGGSKGSSPC